MRTSFHYSLRLFHFSSILIPLMYLVFSAQGEVLLKDTISYPNGFLCVVADGTWTHHSGATNELQTVDGKARLIQNQTEDVNVLIPGQPYLPSSGMQLFVAFDVTLLELPKGAGSYFAHFKDAGNGFRAKIFAVTNNAALGCFRLGISTAENTPSAVINQDLELNKNYRVVCGYSLMDGSCSLWLDPKNDTAPDVKAMDVAGTLQIAAFALRQSSGIGSLEIDNIIIASEFSDILSSTPFVIPPTASTRSKPTYTNCW